MLFIALYSVWNEIKCPFFWPFPLWCGLECKLDWSIHTNGPYAVRVVQLYGSATWQREIVFTHWQLWLSGLQSAKKRFTQMAREREHGGWMVEVAFAVSFRPLHTCVLNISSVGWCVLADMFVGLHECERIWWVYSVCVCQWLRQPAEATWALWGLGRELCSLCVCQEQLSTHGGQAGSVGC